MSAGEMICRLFHARTAAHMAHLQTRSFAEHKALNDFYDEVVGLADSFAETYQGIFGLITDYPDCGLPAGKPVQWLDGLRNWLEKNRDANCQGKTALENINDELMALCAQTVYKLKFLDSGAGSVAEEASESPSQEKAEYMTMSKW